MGNLLRILKDINSWGCNPEDKPRVQSSWRPGLQVHCGNALLQLGKQCIITSNYTYTKALSPWDAWVDPSWTVLKWMCVMNLIPKSSTWMFSSLHYLKQEQYRITPSSMHLSEALHSFPAISHIQSLSIAESYLRNLSALENSVSGCKAEASTTPSKHAEVCC